MNHTMMVPVRSLLPQIIGSSEAKTVRVLRLIYSNPTLGWCALAFWMAILHSSSGKMPSALSMFGIKCSKMFSIIAFPMRAPNCDPRMPKLCQSKKPLGKPWSMANSCGSKKILPCQCTRCFVFGLPCGWSSYRYPPCSCIGTGLPHS